MIFHPEVFLVDPDVRIRYGVERERLFVVRFSAYTASHDRKARGMPESLQAKALERLRREGTVLLSREGHGNALMSWGNRRTVSVSPTDFHQLLATADLYVGDSQSVAAEAAVLGVPSLHMSSFSGHLFYIQFLEQKELIKSFLPSRERAFLNALDSLIVNNREAKLASRATAIALNNRLGDPLDWYVSLVTKLLTER